MKKVIGVLTATFLMSLLLALSVVAYTKQDYLQLVENKADITTGYTWYRICNPTPVPYSISDSSKINITFVKVKNKLNSYRYTKLTNVSYSITKYDKFCTSFNITYSLTNTTPEHTETYTDCALRANGTTTGYKLEWVEWNPLGQTILANTCYDVKVEGKYPAVLGGTAIDNMVSFAGFSYPEYAWWNTTWNSRCQINLTATGDILHNNSEDNPWDYIEIRPTPECNFNFSGDIKDVRIVKNNTDGTMTSLVRDNYKNQSIIFMLNSSINGTTDSNYYLYFNATGVGEPSQTDYVVLSGAGNISVRNRIYNITNCAISNCINSNGDDADKCFGYNLASFSIDGENSFACGGVALDANSKQCSLRFDGYVMGEVFCENQGSTKPSNLYKIYANSFINITSSVATSASQGSVRDVFDGTTDTKWYDGKIERDIGADPNTNFDSDLYGNGTSIGRRFGGSWNKDIIVKEWYVPQSNVYTTQVRNTYNGNGFQTVYAINTNGPSYNFSRWFGMATNQSSDSTWYYRGDYLAKGLRNPVTYKLGNSEVQPSGPTFATESEGDDSIESGINTSVINGSTILSNQQVYIRTQNNTQVLGKFDKVAISGNQRWAFNYVTASDPTSQFTNMVNITPSFYVLEFANRTSTNISREVSGFINATKQ